MYEELPTVSTFLQDQQKLESDMEDHQELESEMEEKCIVVNNTFDTFAQFQHHLNRYCLENGVQYVISSSKPVAWANQRLQPGEIPFGDQLKYKYATFSCKQGKPRASESTGIRPVQRYLFLCSNLGGMVLVQLYCTKLPQWNTI